MSYLEDDDLHRRFASAYMLNRIEELGAENRKLEAERDEARAERLRAERMGNRYAAERDEARARLRVIVKQCNYLTAQMFEKEAERDEAYKLLHDLTPMGSEYVNNPKRCARWIEEQITWRHGNLVETHDRLNKAEAEVERLRAVVAAARRLVDVSESGYFFTGNDEAQQEQFERRERELVRLQRALSDEIQTYDLNPKTRVLADCVEQSAEEATE